MRRCSRCRKEKPDEEFQTKTQCRRCSERRRKYTQNPQVKLSWFQAHRKHLVEYNRAYRASVKAEMVAHYGGQCTCCGESDIRFLTTDHEQGGGRRHKLALGLPGGFKLWSWLKKQGFPSGYTVLCFNCNCGRYPNGGICPHQQSSTANPLKVEVMAHYSGGLPACACCGEPELGFLTMDHIHGRAQGGPTNRGKQLYEWLRNNRYPEGYRVLCFNCNCGRKLGACPHEASSRA